MASEGNAARCHSPTLVSSKMRTASVSHPNGRVIRVIGISFMTSTNTSAQAAASPGASWGKCTRRICANLPYIPTETLHSLSVYKREPTLALDGGLEGLDLIRKLMERVPECFAPGGLILLEIEANQGLKASSLAGILFPDTQVRLHRDLAGHDRLLEVAL